MVGELSRLMKKATVVVTTVLLAACSAVGPHYERPETQAAEEWAELPAEGLIATDYELVQWWEVFNDPVLNSLVNEAHQQNYTLQLAGLRVLESRAQLGVATGLQWPQVQQADGGVARISQSENAGGAPDAFTAYNTGLTLAWEMDFWGRFRNGIEAADASMQSSIANYDSAMILITAAVVEAYATVRTLEEQLRIANQNLELQQRSYDIAEVLFRNGESSELDVQQALTLLLSTKASIPAIETGERLARNALSTLLGREPQYVDTLLGEGNIPIPPSQLAVGIPADLLRRRPDVRSAEMLAVAQNALVGVATADLYPSIALGGTFGVSALSSSDLFDGDSVTWAAGLSFNWPIFNYGRVRNNIRVQDARLQQTLVNYQSTVLNAVKEVDDAMVQLAGAQAQHTILKETVAAAERSNELSLLQYQEGFAGYQRVLDAQRALFSQQSRLVDSRGEAVRAVIQLYKALGGGWEIREGRPYVNEETQEIMRQRTNWGGMLDND